METRADMEAAFEEKLKHFFDGVVLPLENKARMLENIKGMIAAASANRNLPEALEDLDEPQQGKS